MVKRRLARLCLHDSSYPILALDHGLTIGSGDVVPVQKVVEIIKACSPDIGGVVLTYGLFRSCNEIIESSLILQCFGGPFGSPRIQISSIDQALRLDAAAVAVQINFNETEHLSRQTREIAKFVAEAHSMGMPVLFMASGFKPTDLIKVTQSIRMCQELGADLVKIRCMIPENKEVNGMEDLMLAIRQAPPLLLAGGPAHAEIIAEVANTRQLGFSGYCIGRNIFQADNPSQIVKYLRNALEKTFHKGGS